MSSQNTHSFPKIDSPCPLQFNGLPSTDRNFCRQCSRSVVNLNAMSPSERTRFMQTCSGQVCVAYALRVPKRAAPAGSVLAGGLAALLAIAPALAESTQSPVSPALDFKQITEAEPVSGQRCDDDAKVADPEPPEIVLLMGGVSDLQHAELIDGEAADPAEIPLIAEDLFLPSAGE